MQGHEGYSAYKADIRNQFPHTWNRDEIIRDLCPKQDDAPSGSDALIGHIKAWVRYEFGTYDLRMGFFDERRLREATLMVK